MKGIRTLASAIALLCGAAAADAADLLNGGGSGSLKDPGGNSQICGLYLEALAGPGFSENATATTQGNVTLSETGGVAVGRVGYDKCGLMGRFGLGLYVEGSNNFDINGSATKFISFGQQYGFGAGGKFFYDHGLGQIYGLLGYAGVQDNITGTTKWNDGYLWGAGISLKVTGNFYAKMEFDQVHYGDLSAIIPAISTRTPIKWNQTDDRLLFGVGYSLGN